MSEKYDRLPARLRQAWREGLSSADDKLLIEAAEAIEELIATGQNCRAYWLQAQSELNALKKNPGSQPGE